jgi:hypothetical protein
MNFMFTSALKVIGYRGFSLEERIAEKPKA